MVESTQRQSKSCLEHLLVHPNVISTMVIALFKLKKHMNGDVDENLISLFL